MIDRKEQFPITCFGSKTIAKSLIKMLFNSAIQVLTAACVKPVWLFGKKDIDGGHKRIKASSPNIYEELALCTQDGS